MCLVNRVTNGLPILKCLRSRILIVILITVLVINQRSGYFYIFCVSTVKNQKVNLSKKLC